MRSESSPVSLAAPRRRISLDELRASLLHFAAMPREERIAFDPVELPRRYSHPRDIEVAGLLSAAMAYGRADLFKPKIAALLEAMGSSPSTYVCELTPRRAGALLRGFVYRFNVGADIAVLLSGAGRAIRERGSLEALFAAQLARHGNLHAALSGFTAALRSVPMEPIRRELGPVRALDHLLPTPLGPGAAKRLNLFLRWMVRGPDEVDFGIWRKIPPSKLVVPLDTHVGRIARHLGLTRRRDLTWKTAEEITAALRQVDPFDPVRFDFAICHHGMSGACPPKPSVQTCSPCALNDVCLTGRRILGRSRNRTTPVNLGEILRRGRSVQLTVREGPTTALLTVSRWGMRQGRDSADECSESAGLRGDAAGDERLSLQPTKASDFARPKIGPRVLPTSQRVKIDCRPRTKRPSTGTSRRSNLSSRFSSMATRDLLNEALRLPPKERGRLVRDLIKSLEDANAEDPLEVEREWAAELEARANRALSGESHGKSFESVCDALEAKRRKKA